MTMTCVIVVSNEALRQIPVADKTTPCKLHLRVLTFNFSHSRQVDLEQKYKVMGIHIGSNDRATIAVLVDRLGYVEQSQIGPCVSWLRT